MTEQLQDDGATAVGLFLLANDYLASAHAASSIRLSYPGPVRLLCLHACELYLKAYLREKGSTHGAMRKLRHNLSEHAARATEAGLPLSKACQNDLETVTDINAYVSSRYGAASPAGPFSNPQATLRLAEDVREVVRHALHLNELGMPTTD